MFDSSVRLRYWYDLFAVCGSCTVFEIDGVGYERKKCWVAFCTYGDLVCCQFTNYWMAMHEVVEKIDHVIRAAYFGGNVFTDWSISLAITAKQLVNPLNRHFRQLVLLCICGDPCNTRNYRSSGRIVNLTVVI